MRGEATQRALGLTATPYRHDRLDDPIALKVGPGDRWGLLTQLVEPSERGLK